MLRPEVPYLITRPIRHHTLKSHIFVSHIRVKFHRRLTWSVQAWLVDARANRTLGVGSHTSHVFQLVTPQTPCHEIFLQPFCVLARRCRVHVISAWPWLFVRSLRSEFNKHSVILNFWSRRLRLFFVYIQHDVVIPKYIYRIHIINLLSKYKCLDHES